MRIDIKRYCDILDADVAVTPLDASHAAPVEATKVDEAFLRQAFRSSCGADVAPKARPQGIRVRPWHTSNEPIADFQATDYLISGVIDSAGAEGE